MTSTTPAPALDPRSVPSAPVDYVDPADLVAPIDPPVAAPRHRGADNPPRRPRSRPRNAPDARRAWTKTLGRAVTTLFCVASLAAVIGTATGQFRLDVVLSGSMSPTYQPGDLVVATPASAEQITVGDVLMFRTPPQYGSETVTHRIARVTTSKIGVVSVRTKGDNNDSIDPWNAQFGGQDVWIVHHEIPKVGYLAVWSKNWWPALVAIAIATPMLAYARRRLADSRRTPRPADADESSNDPGRRPIVVLAWFIPGLVVIASGLWAVHDGARMVEKVSSHARSWQAHDTGARGTLLNNFTLPFAAVADGQGSAPRLESRATDDSVYETHDGALVTALDLDTSQMSPAQGLNLTAATGIDELDAALRLHVESCDRPWTGTREGPACPIGAATTLVGDAPLDHSTVSILGRGAARQPSTHLLLRVRTTTDAITITAASLAIRLDAS